MAGSVFEQYQRYFDSLITQHKASCQLENPHQQLPHLTQDPNAKETRHLQPAPTNWQPNADMSQLPPTFMAPPPMYQPYQPIYQPNPIYRQAYGAPVGYDYYGRGPGVMPYQQQPYQQQMMQMELARNPESDKKPATLCYPFGVSGYEGGISCSPCAGCKHAMQPEPATQKPQHKQQLQHERDKQQLQHERDKQQPCVGKDCNSGWVEAYAGGESASKGNRLPLGVQEPFIVGPTTYQYFYDHPA